MDADRAADAEQADAERADAEQADAEQAGEFDLGPTATPVLLWAQDARRGRLVAACCPRARSMGVRAGMPLAQAGEMARHVAGRVTVEPHDVDRDDEALETVAWWLQQNVTPMVAIETLDDQAWDGHPRHQCESLLCEISGASHLFGGESGLLAMVTEGLATMGLAARMAIADSVGAAWAVAHESPARSHQPADRCFVVPESRPGVESSGPSDSLGRLPVRALRIPAATTETLARLGVETIGQLLRLPRSGLAPRLGMPLVRRIEQVLGEVDEPLGMYRHAGELSETVVLEYPTTDGPILADRIERLTDRVRTGLATRQRGALRLTCRLDLAVHPPQTFRIGLFAPTLDAKHLCGLLCHRLEQIRLPSDVTGITLAVTLTGPMRTVQTPLFDSHDESASLAADSSGTSSLGTGPLARLIDSLSGRLGIEAVRGVQLRRDPLPEDSFGSFPLAGRVPASVRGQTRTKSPGRSRNRASVRRQTAMLRVPGDVRPLPTDAMRRPLAMMVQPKPLAVGGLAQTNSPIQTGSPIQGGALAFDVASDAVPTRIRLGGQVHRVVRLWGPERIETGWWKGPMIARDYFRVETDRGQWWWVYRERIPGHSTPDRAAGYRWMLHGRFA